MSDENIWSTISASSIPPFINTAWIICDSTYYIFFFRHFLLSAFLLTNKFMPTIPNKSAERGVSRAAESLPLL